MMHSRLHNDREHQLFERNSNQRSNEQNKSLTNGTGCVPASHADGVMMDEPVINPCNGVHHGQTGTSEHRARVPRRTNPVLFSEDDPFQSCCFQSWDLPGNLQIVIFGKQPVVTPSPHDDPDDGRGDSDAKTDPSPHGSSSVVIIEYALFRVDLHPPSQPRSPAWQTRGGKS